MTSALVEIAEWVDSLEYWEQVAFDLILQGNQLTDDELDKLVGFLLEENDLVEKTGRRPKLKYKELHEVGDEIAPFTIRTISNLHNINALAKGQSLEFGPNLTAIFGVNGSGKSGYARVLGSAGFTRGDEEIIPDITKPFNPDEPQTVDIDLESNGKTILLEHEVGSPCPELSSFYIFDSTSVIVHLTQRNVISFSPAGLSNLQALAGLTDKVREKLNQQIEGMKRDNPFITKFHGDSVIKTFVSTISHETDLDELKALAEFTTDDSTNLRDNMERLNTIETKGVPAQIKELDQSKADLEGLVARIKTAASGLGNEIITAINQEINEANANLEVANALGLETFKAGTLDTVGTVEWHTFIHAAKGLALLEEDVKKISYPQDVSHCLLCQQPLSKDALDLINQLWAYLGSEVQEKLKLTEEKLLNRFGEINDLSTAFIDDQLAVSRLIRDRDKELYKEVKDYRDILDAIKESIKKGIEEKKEIDLYNISIEYVSAIEVIIERIDGEIVDWKKEEGEEEEIRNAIRELDHKKILSNELAGIEEFIQELTWIQNASNIGGTTRHITTKYNQMFSELVTDEYIGLFEKTLENLGRPLSVEIVTRARKGEVYKQLTLEADETTPPQLTNPDKILSEGEKRAVALADFLTEVTLDSTSRGIILDDPVTSLDIAWRQLIAKMLAEEAKKRQVIVFTHDMPFLYYLREASSSDDVPADYHWITRGSSDGLPGYIHLNNSPVLERDYRDDRKARECYEQAKGAEPEKQLSLMREGFAALRTSYEAVIMFDLLKGVVKRFDERTSFMNLKSIVWDEELVDKIVEKCEYCSQHMEGHSHSDALGAELPSPKLLFDEIEEFNEIRRKAKQRR